MSSGVTNTTLPRIRYMGNKSGLAVDVSRVIDRAEPTRELPLVDLFSGMCSIAAAVSASRRRVWSNDVQAYARLTAYCMTATADPPPPLAVANAALVPAYEQNAAKLRRRFRDELRFEAGVLAGDSRAKYVRAQRSWRHGGNDATVAREVERLHRSLSGPHRLATLLFAWGYFGLHQAIEIDSIRAAIDFASAEHTLTEGDAAWCRLALLQACSRAASSPGHFAQFLTGSSEESYRRIQRSRRVPVWSSFATDLATLSPFATKTWRSRNRVFQCDAVDEIWPTLDRAGLGRAVFYADPPYSKEQYSRFYHVLETIERYDYPDAVGVGRYRSDRFSTSLATRRGALPAIRKVFEQVAERESVLVLSYPSSGLLTDAMDVDLTAVLGEYFTEVSVPIVQPATHSTLGARHGSAAKKTVEYVWMAR